MSHDKQLTPDVNKDVKRYILIEDIIMILLIILSMTGIAIMDFSPKDGYVYWMFMIMIFGVAAMAISLVQAKRGKHMLQDIWIEQSLLWLGVLAALCGTLLLHESGNLVAQNTSLVMLLILSLACYIDGLRINWRFSLVGNFLGLTAVTIAYLDNFMWVLYLIAGLTIGLTIYFDRFWLKKQNVEKSLQIEEKSQT